MRIFQRGWKNIERKHLCYKNVYIPLWKHHLGFSFAWILEVFGEKQCGRDPMLGRFLSVRSSNCLTSPRFGMEKSCPRLGTRSTEGPSALGQQCCQILPPNRWSRFHLIVNSPPKKWLWNKKFWTLKWSVSLYPCLQVCEYSGTVSQVWLA